MEIVEKDALIEQLTTENTKAQVNLFINTLTGLKIHQG